jgi:alpha-tubulin suppressor-like RCC1 family protein
VRCWGVNGNGQLGVGNTERIGDDEPASDGEDVDLGAAAVHVSVGFDFACALTDQKRVRCWGHNADGQLGYGNTESIGDDEAASTAGEVNVGGDVTALSAAAHSACVILEGGDLRCWGRNDEGQLGYGHTDNIGDDESPAAAGDVNVGGPVQQVAVQLRHTCALLENGKVRCWGQGVSGQLGYGNTESIGDDESPFVAGDVMVGADADTVRVGNAHSCARVDGTDVRCWGAGALGRLGYGNTNTIGDGEFPSDAGDVPVGLEVDQLAVGDAFACVRAGAQIRCWGWGIFGELGLGNTEDYGDDEPAENAGFVDAGGDIKDVVLGANHACVRMSTGGVRCWGRNHFGQLGLGHTQHIGDDELPAAVAETDVGW